MNEDRIVDLMKKKLRTRRKGALMNLVRRLETGAATYHDTQLLLILLSDAEAGLRACINALHDPQTAAQAMLVQRRLQEVFDEDESD